MFLLKFLNTFRFWLQSFFFSHNFFPLKYLHLWKCTASDYTSMLEFSIGINNFVFFHSAVLFNMLFPLVIDDLTSIVSFARSTINNNSINFLPALSLSSSPLNKILITSIQRHWRISKINQLSHPLHFPFHRPKHFSLCHYYGWHILWKHFRAQKKKMKTKSNEIKWSFSCAT